MKERYNILTHISVESFIALVNDQIEQGARPIGGAFVGASGRWAQTVMVPVVEDEPVSGEVPVSNVVPIVRRDDAAGQFMSNLMKGSPIALAVKNRLDNEDKV